MKAAFKQNAFLRFVFLAACLYFILFLVYQFIVKRYTYYDQKFIGSIILSVDYFLNLIGYTTFMELQDQDYQVLGIDGSNGVWVGSNCNAITLFSLFSVFVLAYPGAQKNKIWFIPVGILVIHFLNLLRVTALVVIDKFAPNYLDFNHTYTFTFLIYAVIFSLWMIWVNKFSKHSVTQVKNEN
jgi:exosortase family protein XrtF